MRELAQSARTDWVRCGVCGGLLPLAGPFGLVPHVIQQHADSPMGHDVLRLLAREALPPARARRGEGVGAGTPAPSPS